ncbi:MAG: phosphoribosylamine--glycine ligase [Chloroflexi bacterium]|nr:phosphoribosylamine--glycine ligase [Chloroflexota bacterium]
MNVLVVGNGAREHAIAWKFSQSSSVGRLYVAPGNAGTHFIATNVPIGAEDIPALINFASNNAIDLTVVGPEAPLAAGIVDSFTASGLPVFGPTQAAARIEGSKSFAKTLMADCSIPTAASETFTDFERASAYLDTCPIPIVVKADGLAAGKGVTVAQTREQAQDAVRESMLDRAFGDAGDRVLIEECLEGQEVSVFAFVDGEYVSPMIAACDYKRVGDGDTGPNTGGMGSFSPPLPQHWNADIEALVRASIMEPVTKGLVDIGSPYRGVLYMGMMLTKEGPKVVEFNCRFGDPETQVILPRLESDLADILLATACGDLQDTQIEWDARACVGVVAASGGYPAAYATGYPIDGVKEIDYEAIVFHAGTKLQGDEIVTDGGRVLTVSALGDTHEQARTKAYDGIRRITFKDGFYRTDIANF